MVLLDLLTPYFSGWSRQLARESHHDVADIRSAMMEGALEAWHSKAVGTPAGELLNAMMRRAFTGARAQVSAGSSETCALETEYLVEDAVFGDGFALHASSIVDAGAVRDPDADERIRGERTGALLRRMGAMESVRDLHERLRSGRRNEMDAPIVNPAQMGRSWVDGANLYYRLSDLLPQYIEFKAAANAVGISESQASKMARKGSLPFRCLWIGNSRVVAVRSLMGALDVQDSIVHPDDVENGAFHVGEG
ncbi:hypothetical protein JGS22_007090 [Streptomyces sp. P38-E01]|uniref:Uncharacterized protein n=1 Tax=Streptomyces tardus TaxID=2780544 RepID=A0A949JDF8_9ACTN|nr:hypothetical protein [Streptomyces tardus]MBU7597402.1 hypothetical protein [Streptomyces tardus]